MKIAINGELRITTGDAMEELPAAPGVFETFLVTEGAPVFFDDHWMRFTGGCRHFGFEPPVSGAEASALATTLIGENLTGRTGVLRIAAWRSGPRVEWRIEAGAARPHMRQSTFRASFGPRVLPPPGADRRFKHLGRAAWLEALRTARSAGWDESILSDDRDRVVEACVSNVFFIRDGCLHTPALETGPLPGVMRARILALARTLAWTVQEGEYRQADLRAASEIWLSNSLIGLRPLSCLGEDQFDPHPPRLGRLRGAWRQAFGWDPLAIA